MTAPIHGKRFWLDPKLPSRGEAIRWVRNRGGVLAEVDATLDYLVLAEIRRAEPGGTPAEKKAAKVTAGKISTRYESELPPLLLPTPEEVLACLRPVPFDGEAWEALLPPYGSPWTVDIAGADLSGLELVNVSLRNLNLDGILLRGTNLHHSSINAPRNVDFRDIRLPASVI